MWFGLFSYSLFVPLGSLPGGEGEGVGTSLRACECECDRHRLWTVRTRPDRKGLSGGGQGVGSRVVWCPLIATVRSHQHQTDVLGLERVPCWARLPGSQHLTRVSTLVSIPQIGYVGGTGALRYG